MKTFGKQRNLEMYSTVAEFYKQVGIIRVGLSSFWATEESHLSAIHLRPSVSFSRARDFNQCNEWFCSVLNLMHQDTSYIAIMCIFCHFSLFLLLSLSGMEQLPTALKSIETLELIMASAAGTRLSSILLKSYSINWIITCLSLTGGIGSQA